jgi:hypothetical protein
MQKGWFRWGSSLLIKLSYSDSIDGLRDPKLALTVHSQRRELENRRSGQLRRPPRPESEPIQTLVIRPKLPKTTIFKLRTSLVISAHKYANIGHPIMYLWL